MTKFIRSFGFGLFLGLLALAFLFGGCASSYNRRWLGRPSWQVLILYGKPSEVTPIDDSEIWYYAKWGKTFKIHNRRVLFAQKDMP